MKRALVLVCLTLVILSVGCQAQVQPPAGKADPGYQNLSPKELKALLEKEDPFLLDVHVPNQGYLPGTDARIPYTDVAARAAELPSDRSARIVVYCMSGRMSAIAAPEVVRLGYRNVVNLDGGTLAWKAAGYEVIPE